MVMMMVIAVAVIIKEETIDHLVAISIRQSQGVHIILEAGTIKNHIVDPVWMMRKVGDILLVAESLESIDLIAEKIDTRNLDIAMVHFLTE